MQLFVVEFAAIREFNVSLCRRQIEDQICESYNRNDLQHIVMNVANGILTILPSNPWQQYGNEKSVDMMRMKLRRGGSRNPHLTKTSWNGIKYYPYV